MSETSSDRSFCKKHLPTGLFVLVTFLAYRDVLFWEAVTRYWLAVVKLRQRFIKQLNTGPCIGFTACDQPKILGCG